MNNRCSLSVCLSLVCMYACLTFVCMCGNESLCVLIIYTRVCALCVCMMPHLTEPLKGNKDITP